MFGVGVNLKNPAEMKKIETKIESKVKDIVNKLKASHGKFEDKDFGPNEKDTFGAISFYGSALPAPAGSKYPAPETLKWERPLYDDSKFDGEGGAGEGEEEVEEEEVDDYEDEFGFQGEEEEDQVLNTKRFVLSLCKQLFPCRFGADMESSF